MSAPEDAALWPDAIDLEALAEREPEQPRHIIAGWLPAGEVTLFAGHGGSGKSAIALYIACCIALGRPVYGLETQQRPVLYVSAEDPESVLHWRLTRICAHLGASLDQLVGNLRIVDASNIEAELMIERPNDEPVLSMLYDELKRGATAGRVLILDGASDVYGASEIVRRHVRRFVRALRRLADPDGAVMLLAHIDKAVARGNASGDYYSGSTAWNNSTRARWALKPDGDCLNLELEKANHAQAGAQIRLRWNATAHLYQAEGTPTEGGIVASIRERQERDAILAALRACNDGVPAATTGQRTAYHVLSARPELPESMRAGTTGRRLFWRRLEELRAMGVVKESSITRKDRHPVRILVAS